MKRSILFVLTGLLLSATTTKAQFGQGKPEDIEQLKHRGTIVIVAQPDAKLVKKLTKKGKTDDLATYTADIKEYNDNMKAVIEKFWKYSDGSAVQYMTIEEAKKVPNKSKYALVYCASVGTNNYYGYNILSSDDGLDWDADARNEGPTSGNFTAFCVQMLDKKNVVYQMTLPDVLPTKADVAYAILSTSAYFTYRAAHTKPTRTEAVDHMKELQAQLKTKTLLLRKDWVDEKTTDADIHSAYPYKTQIVEDNKLDEYVMNADSNYAYGVITPLLGSREIIFVQLAISCKDGETLGMSYPSMGGMLLGGYTGKSGHSVFTKKTLADFCEYITGKKK